MCNRNNRNIHPENILLESIMFEVPIFCLVNCYKNFIKNVLHRISNAPPSLFYLFTSLLFTSLWLKQEKLDSELQVSLSLSPTNTICLPYLFTILLHIFEILFHVVPDSTIQHRDKNK